MRIKKHISYSTLAIFLFLLNILAKYFLPSFMTKMLPIAALAIAVFFCGRSFLLYKNLVLFLMFGVWYLISSLMSTDVSKGLMYAITFIISVLFINFMQAKNIEWKFLLNIYTLGTGILALFVIIQSINPDFVLSITSKFNYTTENYISIAAGLRNNWYFGLFNDRAPAAFFGAMFCGCGIYYILQSTGSQLKEKKTKAIGVFILVVGLWSIFLTAKRGLLIGMLVAALVCYIVNRRANGKSVFIILLSIVIIGLCALIIIMNVDVTRVMLDRFFNNDNFMTNRDNIYLIMYKNIEQHFLIGTGTGSADDILGMGGHNIYLTVLMENGIVGLVLFVTAFLSELIITVKHMLLHKYNPDNLAIISLSIFIQCFFLVYGFTGNPLYDNYIMYNYFWGILLHRNVMYAVKHEQYS